METMVKSNDGFLTNESYQFCESYAGVQDLVKLMIESPCLIANWTQLCDSLGLQPQEKAKWKQGIDNANLKYYDVFCEMISNWARSAVTSCEGTNQQRRTVQDLCQILSNDMNCISLADRLGDDFWEMSIISTSVANELDQSDKGTEETMDKKTHFLEAVKFPKLFEPRPERKLLQLDGLKYPNSNFSGRKAELNKLKTMFTNSNENNVVLVCGIGGIGKTELCKKFANDTCYHQWFGKKIRRLHPISSIWLHMNTYETLSSSLFKCGKEFGAFNETYNLPSEYFKLLTSQILEKCSRLLVIIDNVDIAHEEVAKIIKTVQITKYKCTGNIFLIVTSRNSMVLDGVGYTMKLEAFTIVQAISMLKFSIDSLTDPEAEKLCELVQYFPLALQQSVSYIKEQRKNSRTSNYSVSNYVEKFELRKSEMIDNNLSKFENDYSVTTLVTWYMTIEKMSKTAIEILKILAFLDPDGIQLELLEKICQKQNCDYEDLHLLHNYSLVKIENETVSIHRLVQDVMREKILNQEEYAKTLIDSLFLVCVKFRKGQGPSRSKLVHLNCISRFVWKCEIGYDIWCFREVIRFLLVRDRINCALECITLNFPRIQFASDFTEVNKREWIVRFIWWGLLYRDDYDSASIERIERDISLVSDRKLLEEGLKLCQKYVEQGCELTFKIKNQIAERLCFEGEFDNALTLCDELLNSAINDSLRKVYFETINYIVWKLDQIDGDRTKYLIKLSKIIANFDEYKSKAVLVIIELTDFNQITCKTIVQEFSNVDYWRLPLLELERILPFYELKLGKFHPLTVRVKNKLAGKLLQQNTEKDRRIKLLKEVLSSPVDSEYEEAFQYLCKSKFNDDGDNLETFLIELLKVKRLTWAENHSNIFRIKVLLGKAMEESGKLNKALELFEQIKDSAVYQCEWNQNDSSQNVMRVKLRLGYFSSFKTPEDIYREFGELEDYTKLSLKQLSSVLVFYKSILGEHDKLTLKVINAIAWKLYTEKKCTESLELLELVINSNGDGDEIKSAYSLMHEIGKCLFYKKVYKKSKELLERVLEFRIMYLGKNHSDTVHTKDVLAWVLRKYNHTYWPVGRIGL